MSGCGAEPRIDATNEETAKASVVAVANSLSSADKAAFQSKISGSMMSVGLKKFGLTKGGKITIDEIVKPYHGMTGAEVLQAAREAK
ncbi:MAG: hypothetical protein ABS85_11870 [Sphingobacteriales bacterium SCN 48-20]|nr:MAG: hypothetical protein ABS85_11870 [Sphingobacteriales bacterium SCN 48-20]